jgi:adenylate cyclase
VRITGQLIEAETGAHLWAERFEGALDDVFELQDRITAAVATAVAPSLRSAEIERARRKPPSSLAAYDLLLRALPGFHAMTRDGTDEALGLVRQALSLEPRYAPAAALCALIHGYRVNQGHAADAELEFAECRRLARVAADHGGSDPEVLALAARCLALHGELDEAQRLAAHALAAQPHVAQVAAEAGWVRLYRAEYAAGASLLERALALDALDPMAYTTLGALAQCRLGLGDYPGAIATARRALDRRPHYASAHRVLSSALALSGAMAEAQAVMRRLVEIDPSFSLRHPFLGREPLRSLWASYIGGMRLAGAPE